jgi:hypothetical protein
MTAEMTLPPTIGLRAAKLPVRDIEANSQPDARAFGRQRLFEFPDEAVEFAARGTP